MLGVRSVRTSRTLLLVAALATALVVACGKKETAPAAKPPVEVSVVTVAPRDTPAVFEYVAQTQSSRQVNIQARVSGFLDKRVYTEGSIVKAGQVLFLMDKKPFQAQVDAAKAQLSKSQAALEVAKSNLARVKPLTEKEALSQKDLDDATGNFESAAATVEGSKAQLETAQLNLSYCTITSPVAGISGAAAQADGTYLNQSNSQLTTVAVLSPMWVNFSLSENEMQGFRDQVEKGQLRRAPDNNYLVEIVLVDGQVFPFTGRITFTDPAFNAQTGTFLVRVRWTTRTAGCGRTSTSGRESRARRARTRSSSRSARCSKAPRVISCGLPTRTTRRKTARSRSATGPATTGSSPRACAPATGWWWTAASSLGRGPSSTRNRCPRCRRRRRRPLPSRCRRRLRRRRRSNWALD